MAWIYLALAGLSEVGWPLGLKLAQKFQGGELLVLLSLSCVFR